MKLNTGAAASAILAAALLSISPLTSAQDRYAPDQQNGQKGHDNNQQTPGRNNGQAPGRNNGQAPGRDNGQAPGRNNGQAPGGHNGPQNGRDQGGPRPFVQHNEWKRGARMNSGDWNRGQQCDWRAHHFRQPPNGYEWREVDGNYVLAAIATGAIFSVIAGSR